MQGLVVKLIAFWSKIFSSFFFLNLNMLRFQLPGRGAENLVFWLDAW